MKRIFLILSVMLFAITFVSNAKAANDSFTCKCIAKGSGYDNKLGQKICSYDCNCNGFNKNEPPKMNVKLKAEQVLTTAQSRDTWDSGSYICHGQYAYKPNLGDPNWKIQVKFSPFNINSFSDAVFYDQADESIEAAIGVRYYLKRTLTAPEIVQSIREQF